MIPGVDGFMYPNEVELQWSLLIVLYPYITGLVAGAFILASLERISGVEALRPTYRLALLSALAFLLVAPLPLQLHLGHPERSFEMYLTPHTTSAMAMFGFVYLWYLMVVLLLYIVLSWLRRAAIDLPCVDTVARYLLYAFLVDFALELIDLIHRIYEADESFRALDFMVKTRLFTSQIVLQIAFGTIVPLAILAATQLATLTERTRVRFY